MAEESGSFERVKSAWLTPQIIIMVLCFVVTTFVQFKMSDYRLGKLEDAFSSMVTKLDAERLEAVRKNSWAEANMARLVDQQREMREDLQLTIVRISQIEKKVP